MMRLWGTVLLMLSTFDVALEKPTVLLMMSSHASKFKSDVLLERAKDQGFNLVNFKRKGKPTEEIKAVWSSSELVMLDGINAELSKYIFSNMRIT